MSDTNSAIVEAFNLAKQFKSGPVMVRALDGVSFTLPRGRMIAIKGASGSGKTTLLNMLGNLDKPTGGSLIVDGVNVAELRGRDEVRYRLRKVGFVFQSYYLVPNLTALENVMLPMELMGIKPNERLARAQRLLERMGINAAMQARRPSRLSGGEQQRVAIARALANDPPIILGDEPTGNLDSKTGKRIVNLLHSLTQEGRTVIVATHSPAVAASADLVLEMEDGKLVLDSDFTGTATPARTAAGDEREDSIHRGKEDTGAAFSGERDKNGTGDVTKIIATPDNTCRSRRSGRSRGRRR